MAALTKTEIVRRALFALGQAYTLSNVDSDSSTLGAQCRIAYDMGLDESMALFAPWNTFRTFEPLSALANYTPPPCWSYAHQIPSQAMQIITVYPAGGCSSVNYQIFSDVIVSNVNNLMMEYIFKPQPHQMPPVFYTYFIYQVAVLLGPSYAKNESLYNDAKKKLNSSKANAMAKDSQQQTQRHIYDAPLLNVRHNKGRWR